MLKGHASMRKSGTSSLSQSDRGTARRRLATLLRSLGRGHQHRYRPRTLSSAATPGPQPCVDTTSAHREGLLPFVLRAEGFGRVSRSASVARAALVSVGRHAGQASDRHSNRHKPNPASSQEDEPLQVPDLLRSRSPELVNRLATWRDYKRRRRTRRREGWTTSARRLLSSCLLPQTQTKGSTLKT
jgi:hypothetical protein